MPEQARVLINAPADLDVEFRTGSALVDPDPQTATVAVTRADGTVLTPASTPTLRVTTGIYRYVLAPQPELDVLTLTWTATFNGVVSTITTRAEIVGGHLFSLADARTFNPKGDSALADTARFPDTVLAQARDRITDDFEQTCGVSFIPRIRRQTLAGSGGRLLLLDRQTAHRIITIHLDGALLPADGYTLHEDLSVLARAGSDTAWHVGQQVTVVYAHGYRTPPLPVARAALRIVHNQLVGSQIDDRATSFTDELGTFTYAVAGRGTFQPYGIPEVDATLRRYAQLTPGLA